MTCRLVAVRGTKLLTDDSTRLQILLRDLTSSPALYIYVSNSTAYCTQSQAVAEAQQTDGAASTKKLWGGRFTGATDPLMEKFNESLPFDKRMWQEDIRVCSAASSFASSR